MLKILVLIGVYLNFVEVIFIIYYDLLNKDLVLDVYVLLYVVLVNNYIYEVFNFKGVVQLNQDYVLRV